MRRGRNPAAFRPRPARPAEVEPMSRQTPCVLVVEDEGAQREVLQYNLEAEGFDVVVADNGEDALLLVQEEEV